MFQLMCSEKKKRQQRVENIQQEFIFRQSSHNSLMRLLCCTHASFPAHLKITQISGTSGSQVDLSVYLSDWLSLSSFGSEVLVPSTHWWAIPGCTIKKEHKRQMLSQIMMVQDEPAVVTVKLGDVQKIFQIWKLEMILCVKMLCRHIVGSKSLKPLEKIISIFY